MTIQELLVQRGYWPDINGPKKNTTTEWQFRFYPKSLPKDQWIQLRRFFGMWHQYEATMFVYVPKTAPLKTMKDDIYLKPYKGPSIILDRGAA